MPWALKIGVSKHEIKAEAERGVKIGPLKHPPWLGCVTNLVVCWKFGGGRGVSSEHASFAVSPLSLCLFRGLRTIVQQLLLDCQSFSLCHNKDNFYKGSAGRLPMPASPPMQMIQPKKNLGDSQTDHPEGLRYLRSVAKRNAPQNLNKPTGLVEIQSKEIGKCPGSKTDSKHVCLDDTSPTSSLRQNSPI